MTIRTFRVFPAVLLAVFSLAATGCIEFERTLVINKDVSGQASFRMTMNLEPMVRFAAEMEQKSRGKTGALTEEDLAAARKEFAKDVAADFKKDAKPDLGTLPAGFT